MSVNINSIISQYLQFAIEQQHGIDRLGNNMMNLNVRVTNLINLYTSSTNLGDIISSNGLPINQAPYDQPTHPESEINSDLEQPDEFSIPPPSTRTLPRTPRAIAPPLAPPFLSPLPPPLAPPLAAALAPPIAPTPPPPSSTPISRSTAGHRRSSMPLDSADWSASLLSRPTRPHPPPLEIPGRLQPINNSIRRSPISHENSTNENLVPRNVFRNSQRHRIFRFAPELAHDSGLNNILNHSLLDSPIRIRPSTGQIRRGTELLIWNDISDNYQTTCPIDLNSFESADSILRIRECSHIFREINLRRHFRGSPACPICRFDIRDYIETYDTPSSSPSTSVLETKSE